MMENDCRDLSIPTIQCSNSFDELADLDDGQNSEGDPEHQTNPDDVCSRCSTKYTTVTQDDFENDGYLDSICRRENYRTSVDPDENMTFVKCRCGLLQCVCRDCLKYPDVRYFDK